MSDELRNRLGRLDPMHPGVPTEPPTTASARFRMEQIMSTSTQHTHDKARRTRPWRVSIVAVAAAAIAVVGFLALDGDRGEDSVPVAGPPLELSLGEGGSMMTCLEFDVAVLAEMPVAFEGTTTTVEGDRVTLAVDRWYAGGDTTEVVLVGQAGSGALIAGFDFEPGDQYLITATDGAINYCGYSAPATPEMRAFFDEAFGG